MPPVKPHFRPPATAKLLLLDATGIVRRPYRTIPLPDGSERVTEARLSIGRSVECAMRDHAPTHALAVFDSTAPRFRHALYADYKAGRKPMG